MSGRRVLVTGGAGLVGLAVRRALAARGDRALAVDMTDFGRDDPGLVRLSFAQMDALEAHLAAGPVDAIVHAGAVSSPVMARDTPLAIVDVNVTATARLLDIARRQGIGRFVFCSSHVVYGDVGAGLIDEERAPHPATAYAASKVAGEALVECFARDYGVPGVSLRITRVYGPHRRANCFLREIIRDAAAGRPTVIPCDPAFPYHFIHVDDVAGAILAALDAPALPFGALNVTSGERLTMPEVAAIARRVLPAARIELVEGRDPAPEVQEDFSLARIAAALGWRPRLPLSEGFAAYAAAMPEPEAIPA
ncbi:NAD-dependent epimerase/dehydratase family protein [Prosthecomicrobium pneumaticum]|uniref:Nucleoside-diphosphate-sugar epimerase n=1 Tax=Prosthecomicrobium pneumaticum TaxID=81895 RepID=A0A7W9L1Y7_9HYPH|nr:NAD(P)-dependent oxidoreductase [Prosthecomicrobium pneumaticum]MBB5753053.1 nucleoside-diphosphate-sugar epimerase [Prosthecomicrobium pneumaticum]